VGLLKYRAEIVGVKPVRHSPEVDDPEPARRNPWSYTALRHVLRTPVGEFSNG